MSSDPAPRVMFGTLQPHRVTDRHSPLNTSLRCAADNLSERFAQRTSPFVLVTRMASLNCRRQSRAGSNRTAAERQYRADDRRCIQPRVMLPSACPCSIIAASVEIVRLCRSISAGAVKTGSASSRPTTISPCNGVDGRPSACASPRTTADRGRSAVLQRGKEAIEMPLQQFGQQFVFAVEVLVERRLRNADPSARASIVTVPKPCSALNRSSAWRIASARCSHCFC